MSDSVRKEWAKTEKGLYVPSTYLIEGIMSEDKKGGNKGFFKTKLDWVINNLTIILLLPSLLGTIWQILELMSIHISYIRFFSVSQIPVDGALIIFFTFILFSIYKVVTSYPPWIYKLKLQEQKKFSDDMLEKLIKGNKYRLIKLIVGFVLILIATPYTIYYSVTDLFSTNPIFSVIVIGLIVLALLITGVEILLSIELTNSEDIRGNQLRNKNTKIKLEKFINKYSFAITITTLLSAIFIIYVLFSFIKLFSLSFLLPNNLYNTENITQVIENDFNTSKYNIKYLNDKYIFIELCTKKTCNHVTEKEIVIYPTEKVLFD